MLLCISISTVIKGCITVNTSIIVVIEAFLFFLCRISIGIKLIGKSFHLERVLEKSPSIYQLTKSRLKRDKTQKAKKCASFEA